MEVNMSFDSGHIAKSAESADPIIIIIIIFVLRLELIAHTPKVLVAEVTIMRTLFFLNGSFFYLKKKIKIFVST